MNKGTFSERVRVVVAAIPTGKVMSYKEVAEATGSPHAFRAVGNIMNKNRDPLVPCHRVVKSDGSVGGFAWGSKKKLELLKKEGVENITIGD